jgi:hypothetical protein
MPLWKVYWSFQWFNWRLRKWGYTFEDESGVMRGKRGWQIGPVIRESKIKYEAEP